MEEEQRLKKKMNEKKAKQEAERLYKVRRVYRPSNPNLCQNCLLLNHFYLCVCEKFYWNF